MLSGITLAFISVVAELAPKTATTRASTNVVSSNGVPGTAGPARSWKDHPRLAPLARILASAPVRASVIPGYLQRPAVKMPFGQFPSATSGSTAAARASGPGVITVPLRDKAVGTAVQRTPGASSMLPVCSQTGMASCISPMKDMPIGSVPSTALGRSSRWRAVALTLSRAMAAQPRLLRSMCRPA